MAVSGAGESRNGWIDLGGIRKLAERAARDPRSPVAADREAHPLLGPHWVLADHDWHRRREWSEGGAEHVHVDHHLTRYALLTDARLVRSDRWRSETDGEDGRDAPWQGRVRPCSPRDLLTLDRPLVTDVVRHGATTMWGARPGAEATGPWAGVAMLLRALAR